MDKRKGPIWLGTFLRKFAAHQPLSHQLYPTARVFKGCALPSHPLQCFNKCIQEREAVGDMARLISSLVICRLHNARSESVLRSGWLKEVLLQWSSRPHSDAWWISQAYAVRRHHCRPKSFVLLIGCAYLPTMLGPLVLWIPYRAIQKY